jgi:hypothetical protein
VAFDAIFSTSMSTWGEINMGNCYSEDELVFDGEILAFFLLAHTEFSNKQNNLKDFKVLILEADEDYRVTFVPKRAFRENFTLGGRTSLGQSVSYYISKTDNKIMRWHFHK